MEKLRTFERKCFRTCLSMFADPNHQYKKHYSNKTLYNTANIPRIDNFMLKLTRDYFANAMNIKQNNLIYGALYSNPNYYEETTNTGLIPPEAFIYLDGNGLIQDINILTIYHISRHKNNKKIQYKQNINCKTDNIKLHYSLTISYRDQSDTHRVKGEKYW